MEERARRRDLLVGDDEIFAFYNDRIPLDVVRQALRRLVAQTAAQDAAASP